MRFVILEHTGTASYQPGIHWDVMFQQSAGLRTWRVPCAFDQLSVQSVVELPLHRLEYLDYEGPLSDDRGTVRRVDTGEYRLITESDQLIAIEILGAVYRGLLEFQHQAAGWTMTWQP